MEEKDRYEWDAIEGVEWIRDTKIGYLLYRDDMKKLADLLNKQDKRIKELEEENQQLKQQLHDLPKKIVREIKNYKGCYFDYKIGEKIFPAFKITEEDLDTILKKFGGEDE